MLTKVLFESGPALLAAFAAVLCLTATITKLTRNWQIHKLGKRSAVIPSCLFGITATLTEFKYAKANRGRELWTTRFRESQRNTAEVEILWRRFILTAEPENIRAVLATQFYDFGKGQTFRNIWHEFLGDSIFTTDGKEWWGSRQLIRPQFSKDRVSDLHVFERHCQHMMRLVPRDGTTPVDLADLFFRLMLDLATDFLLGESVNSLGGAASEDHFARVFAEIQKHQNDMARAGPLRHFLSGKREFKRNIEFLNAYIEPFVAKALQLRPDELKGKSETDYNFLHALACFTRDPKVLRDQLVSLLLAGRMWILTGCKDTTAGTLSWAVFELAKRPECVARLRQEILDTVGPTAAPTDADLKGMRYLRRVMDETLRLYPAVPFNVRTALKDTVLPTGGGKSGLEPVGVPAGTVVAYSTVVMQRREDIFGPDAGEFKPERWEGWSPNPWTFVPFNGGPRICLGQQFAYAEMGYTLVRLFQSFDAVEDRATQPQFERCEITMSPGAGVRVALRPVEW